MIKVTFSLYIVCMFARLALLGEYGRLRKQNYSGFSIIQTPIIRVQTFGRRLTVPAGKYIVVTEVLLQEKAKLLYERLSWTLQRFFHPVRDLVDKIQRQSLLSKATNAVLQRGNLRGWVSMIIVGFNHSHVID